MTLVSCATARTTDKMTGRFLCEINHLNDRLKFAVKPFDDIPHSKSIAKTTFFPNFKSVVFLLIDRKTTARRLIGNVASQTKFDGGRFIGRSSSQFQADKDWSFVRSLLRFLRSY